MNYSPIHLAIGLLGAAYAGAYFHVDAIINQVLQGNWKAGIPLAVITFCCGCMLHHQRQSDPIKEQ